MLSLFFLYGVHNIAICSMFIADDDYKKCNQSDHFCTKFCPHMANINRCPSVALFLKLFSCNWMPPCSHKKLTLSRISGNIVPKVEKIARLEIRR